MAVLAVGVFTYSLVEAAETIEIVSPAPVLFAGQPLLFHVRLQEFVQPRKATVFYRPVGVSVFRKIPLARESAIDFRGRLPASKSVPPGIEYFITVEDGRGRIHTLPSLNPRKNPIRINLELDRQPPQIENASPGQSDLIQTERPSVKISFTDDGVGIDPASIRVLLDGVDVTGLAAVDDNQVTFKPETDLEPGEHRLVVDVADAVGNRMPQEIIYFTAAPRAGVTVFAGLDSASADVFWDAEALYGLLREKESAFADWKVQSSAAIRSVAAKDRLRTSLDANIWYVDEENSVTSENWDLNNFIATFNYDDRYTLDLGDVTVRGSELTSKALARRGGRLGLDFNGTEAQAFMVRSNAVTGFDHVLGGSDENQQIYGGSLSQEFWDGGRLVFKANYMTGKNVEPNDYNASTQQPGTEGDIASLSFSSRLSADALQVEGEYAGSRFDADISDDRGKAADHAIRAKAFGRLEKADWEIGYRYFGPDFASIANPTGTKDREEIHLGGGVRWGQSSLKAAFLHNRDNVGQDPLLPVIHNTSGTLNYSLTATDWPVLFASASRTHQESFDEPAGLPELENAATTLSFGSSLAAQRWNLAPSYSFTQFDDRGGVSDNDSDTHVFTVAGGIRPTDASAINPSVTYTRIEVKSTDVATRTWLAALSGVVGWWENQVNLNATLSWLDNQTSDGAIDTNTWSGALQFNWSVEKYLLGRGRQTLSLRGQYNLTDNHILDSDREDYIIYAVFSVGVPWKSP